MSVFKCKMCGGNVEFENGATVGICDSCGTKQTLPRLDDEKRANLYDRANHFRRNNEYDKAMGIYEQILSEDNTDSEAYWSLVLCRYGIEYVEDPLTHKRVPTVNRAQFTSIFADEDYKSALQYADGYQKEIYEQEAKAIDEIQKGILAISQKEEPFDVFICYKETDKDGRRTQDSVLANDLYHQLTQEGFKVFFSRITLEDKLGTAYEPYIFAALNSAKVMVVLGTKPEYFNAVWVKNEWSRFLSLMKSDRKRLLIPCYRDMDPYDLPEELSILQSQNMSKIGFMQDLLRGVKKVLDAGQKAAAPVPAAVPVAVPVQAANANAAALIKRGYMALTDMDWNAADHFFDEALNLDAELSDAYLGRFLVERRKSSLDAYAAAFWPQLQQFDAEKDIVLQTDEERDHINEQSEVYAPVLSTGAVWDIYQVPRTYEKTTYDIEGSDEYIKEELENRNLQRAIQFAPPQKQKEIQQVFEKAQQIINDCTAKCRQKNIQELATAQARVQKGLAEADIKVQQVYEMTKAKKEREEQELAERWRQEEVRARERAAQAAKKKRRIIIGISIAAAVIAVFLIVTQIVIPSINYKKAEDLRAAGQYEAAVTAFTNLGTYRDAAEQIGATYYAEGEAMHSAGEWKNAITAFSNAGNYSDAATQIGATYYAEGEALRSAGEWGNAITAFSNAGNYSDAATQIIETKYQHGKVLLAEKDYNGAARIFTSIRDYKDVNNLIASDHNLSSAVKEVTILPGKYITFGHYPQTSDEKDDTPIEWLVLSVNGQKALVISRYGLDVRPYNQDADTTTWENSTIRKWLNDTFLSKAFNKYEQQAIYTTNVANDKSQNFWSVSNGSDTQDKVFLLSYAEVSKYFGVTYKSNYNISSRIQPTPYAIAQGAFLDKNYETANGTAAGWWWLRSPGSNQSCAARIYSDGSLALSKVNGTTGCVRPALWVNIDLIAF